MRLALYPSIRSIRALIAANWELARNTDLGVLMAGQKTAGSGDANNMATKDVQRTTHPFHDPEFSE